MRKQPQTTYVHPFLSAINTRFDHAILRIPEYLGLTPVRYSRAAIGLARSMTRLIHMTANIT